MSTDIRVGDLIKATHTTHSDETIVGRVNFVDRYLVSTATRSITRSYYTFEVLDRPQPPISKELLDGVTDVWNDVQFQTVRDALEAIVNYLREHDNNKESNA